MTENNLTIDTELTLSIINERDGQLLLMQDYVNDNNNSDQDRGLN